MFGGSFFAGMTEAEKREAYAETKRLAKPELFRDGRWFADYWRLRIVALCESESV